MTKITVTQQKVEDHTFEYQIREGERLLTVQQWIDYMKKEDSFRHRFNQVLAEAPFTAYYWEVPPVTPSNLNESFRFVIVNSTALDGVAPMPGPFSEYFREDQEVVSFPNLGGDAQLVVPTPQSPHHIYTHLAKFVREAGSQQLDAFWQRVAQKYEQQLGTAPKWLSTCGIGVYWVHVRTDGRPKYYRHQPYTQWPNE
jgi:hypothetical protein